MDKSEEVVESKAEEAPSTQPAVSRLNRLHRFSIVAYVALMSLATATSAFAANELDIDGAAITGAFFDGANMVLGMSGLLAIMALPYGISFALNFVGGILSRFSDVRFGG